MPPAPRWHGIESPLGPGIAAQDAPYRQRSPHERAPSGHRRQAEGRAAGVIAAHRPQQGTHREPIEPNQADEKPAQRRLRDPQCQQPAAPRLGHAARRPRDLTGHPSTRRRVDPRSARSSVDDAVAAAGRALMMRVSPGGRSPMSPATIPRRRRDTRCRTTDPPTPLETTRPSRGAPTPDDWAWTTTVRLPARRPSLITRLKSARRRTRCAAGSTQAERRSRPLERRADRIARPARVRIRARKPCVLARRRLFG